MKILSVDWAFHKTGIALYDSEKETITTWVYTIKDSIKIKWWDQQFYEWYIKHLRYMILQNQGLNADKILVEVGFGKVDKMSLFYAWFYGEWWKWKKVEFINSSTWIKECLKVNHVNKLKKNQDKQLLKEQFNKRFNIVGEFSQDEIDATMMLLWKYPNIKVKKVEKSMYQF